MASASFKRVLAWLIAGVAVAATPASALAHEERPSTWPTYPGSVPQERLTGATEVVCKPDSSKRIQKLPEPYRTESRSLLNQCRFRDIQAAVDAAANDTTIRVLPGVYQEQPSRDQPFDDPRCANMMTTSADGASVPSYEYQRNCPNAKNLIAIVGDSNGDRRCDDKCGIQIIGSARPSDVLIEGDRKKLNVIRADRADGVYLANFTIQYSDFNNIYAIETNGFRFNNVVSRWSREYGFLSFTSEAGLYENLDAYGNGDSGVYPGSGPQGLESERQCQTYGIELRGVDSHDNNLGYSGTSGDSVWVHDSRFHDNATGLSTDSFAAGHPGAPQHCAKFEDNRIYSNNFNVFTPERQSYCEQPYDQRDPTVVCSAFQVPVGTGMLIAGGNKNQMLRNYVYDNWRNGFMLFWVPATFRGEQDPSKLQDTSFDNRYVGNDVGVTPDGKRAPNGTDFWWDEEGTGNCWQDNVGPGGTAPTSDPKKLPDCDSGGSKQLISPHTTTKDAFLAPCATWDPQTNQFPPGCDWFTTPPKPR